MSDVDEKDTISSARTSARSASDERQVRPSTPEDGPAIVTLMREAGLHPQTDPHYLRWKYWQEHPDWPGPRSFVLTEGHDLLAHGALVPGRLRWGETRARVIHMIDWAARREAVGAGVQLMKQVGRQTQFLLGIGGTEHTRKIMPLMGYRLCGTVTAFVRPLSPIRLLRSPSSGPRWKLGPRFARSVLWSVSAPRGDSGAWRSDPIDPADVKQVADVLPVPAPGVPVLERSPELLRHALACPIAPVELYALKRAGRVGGYFVLSHTPSQARLADLWMDSSDAADWRALVHLAVRQARAQADAAEIAAWASDTRLSQALLECGFHARFTVPIYLRASAGVTAPEHTLRAQMLDSDAFYLYDSRNPLWA